MDLKKIWRGRWKWGILAFVMPIVMIALAIMLLPLKTWIFSDANSQYIDFLTYFRSVVTGNNNFDYMTGLFLGSGGMATAGYYMLSPLNLIAVIFPVEMMPEALVVIMIVKIGLSGLAAWWFFNNIMRNKNQIGSLLLAIGYAVSSFVVLYFWNIMWLDAVMILPVMCAGIKKIVQGESFMLYILALSYAIMANYYTAFMLCIWSVIFFGYEYLKTVDKLNFANIRRRGRIAMRYAISSLIGAGLAAVIIVPVAMDVVGQTQQRMEMQNFRPEMRFPLKTIFRQLTIGAIDGPDHLKIGMPNIFVGTVATVLLVLYFLNGNIRQRNKILAGAVLLILMASTNIKTLNTIWHGGSVEAWFPVRYAFVAGFFILYLAAESLKEITKIGRREAMIGALIYATVIIIVFPEALGAKRTMALYLDVAIVLAAAVMICFISRNVRGQRVLLVLLMAMQTVSLGANAVMAVDYLNKFAPADKESYKKQLAANREVINLVRERAEGYRIENVDRNTPNDAMAIGYEGVSGFNSNGRSDVRDFLQKLGGYEIDHNVVRYKGEASLAVDGLIGVRYVVREDGKEVDAAGRVKIAETRKGKKIYENRWALKQIFGAKWPGVEMPEGKDHAEISDRIYQRLTGKDEKVRDIKGLEAQLVNLNKTKVKIKKITSSEWEVDAEIEEGHDGLMLTVPYDKGWKMVVDGERVVNEKALGAMQFVRMTTGKHKLIMKYYPRGKRLGVAISIGSVIVVLGWVLVEERKNKNMKNKSL